MFGIGYIEHRKIEKLNNEFYQIFWVEGREEADILLAVYLWGLKTMQKEVLQPEELFGYLVFSHS